MITLFCIGILLFLIKLIFIAFQAAWGIAKAVLFVLSLPAVLIIIAVSGLLTLALPLLLIALAAAFLCPFVFGTNG